MPLLRPKIDEQLGIGRYCLTPELSGAAENVNYEAERTTRVRLSAGLGQNQPAVPNPRLDQKRKRVAPPETRAKAGRGDGTTPACATPV